MEKGRNAQMSNENTKQQTFGRTKVHECVENSAECSKYVGKTTCENNAVIRVLNNGNVDYYCEMHAKDFMLERLDYHDK